MMTNTDKNRIRKTSATMAKMKNFINKFETFREANFYKCTVNIKTVVPVNKLKGESQTTPVRYEGYQKIIATTYTTIYCKNCYINTCFLEKYQKIFHIFNIYLRFLFMNTL